MANLFVYVLVTIVTTLCLADASSIFSGNHRQTRAARNVKFVCEENGVQRDCSCEELRQAADHCEKGWINTKCTADADCQAESSRCFEGKCQCKRFYTYSVPNKECIRKDWIETKCTTDADCQAASSRCFKGQCLCKWFYTYSVPNKECIPIASCPPDKRGDTFLEYKNFQYSDRYLKFMWAERDGCLKACTANRDCHGVTHLTWQGKQLWACYLFGLPNVQVEGRYTSYDYGSYYERNCN